jgi:hypothetical protein
MPRPVSKAEVVRRRQEKTKGEERAKRWRLGILLAAGSVAFIALFMLAVFFMPLLRSIQHARLRSSVDQFLTAGGQKAPDAKPHVKGKVIAIDRKQGELDPVQGLLPDEIRAFSASEVGTIALLDWELVSTHGDSGRLSGHYWSCKVTLVDRDSNLIVGEQTVMGASSPVSKGTRYVPPGQVTARKADVQVVEYLKNLERR